MEKITEELVQPNLNNTSTWKKISNRQVTCDICDQSCENEDGTKAFGDSDKKAFEFLKLEGSWGYFSDWDGENWESHICTNCVKTHILPLVKINVKDYMCGNMESGRRVNGKMVYNDDISNG